MTHSWKVHDIFLVVAVLVLCAGGILVIQEYTGFATYVPSEAGLITELILYKEAPTTRWSGLYGLMLRLEGYNSTQSVIIDPSEIINSNPVFDCVPPDTIVELYASQAPMSELDFETASPAPLWWVNEYINRTANEADSANNTFDIVMNVTIGTRFVGNIPGTWVYTNSQPHVKNHQTGVLNISNRIVFVAKNTGVKSDFRGESSNYQMLLGNPNASTYYYLYADPLDECPKGFGATIAGYIDGYTLDEYGQILPNVSVWVGSINNITNSSGYYNITEKIGEYQIVAIKDGYDTYVAAINLTTTLQRHNITMYRTPNATEEAGNASVYGRVVDNTTNAYIPNTTISIYGTSQLTSINGSYNISTSFGTHNIVALKSGYETVIDEVTLPVGAAIEHNFSLIPLHGFVRGVVRESAYNLPLSGIAVSIGNIQSTTNASGEYLLEVPYRTYSLIATHPSYRTEIVNVTVLPGRTTYENITLELLYGGVDGRVQDNETYTQLQNVTVSIAGQIYQTKSNGYYNLTAGAGLHTLGAIKDGYLPYVANITIQAGSILRHNFTMQKFYTTENATSDIQIPTGSVSGLVTSSAGTPLTDVDISIAGTHNTTDANGLYNISTPVGSHNLVAILSGYDTYVAEVNITENNETVHDIVMTATQPTAVGPGVGPGQDIASNVDVGPGEDEARPIVPLIQQPLEIVEFEVSPDRILKKLRQGTYVEVPLIMNNYKKQLIRLEFEVEGEVEKLIELERPDLLIDSEQKGKLSVRILARVPPGVYSGAIQIKGDAEKEIPVDILVYSKDKLPIEVLLIDLILGKKRVAQGGTLTYKIDMQNLLREEEYRVFLFYSLFNLDTNETYFIDDKDIVTIKSTESLIKKYRVGDDIDPGEYQLVVDAQYLNYTTTKKSYLRITLPLAQYKIFGVVPVWLLATILGAILLIVGSILLYIHEQNKKKRYHIEVDYNSLPKPGPRSAFVGLIAETKKPVYFDIDLFQIHTLAAGSTGSGKTISAQVLLEEALLHGAAVIVFDPTAQWTGFLRKCTDKHFLGLYQNFGMKKTDARGFNGNIRQIMDAREKLDIQKYMKPGEITIFAINRLQPEDIDILVSNTIQSVFKADLPESKQLRLVILFEEVHRLLPKFGGSGAGFRQIERGAREFRKWGVGLLLISQVLSDFAGEIKANINTEIQLRTRHEGDMKRIADQYGEDVLKSIVKAQVGTGMVQNSNYNHGRPFFVAFRPLLHNTARLSDDELQQYNKYNDIIDDIEYQMEQLKDEGLDVFDMQLEVKLAKDKLKTGNFNMVGIYLEGITPRLEEQWKKLGKTPKKKVRELVADQELQEDMQEAVEKRQQAEDENKQEENAAEGKTSEKEGKESAKQKEEHAEENTTDKGENASDATSNKKDSEPKNSGGTKTNPETSGQSEDINTLIDKANDALAQHNISLAKKVYMMIQKKYQQLPKEQKNQYLKQCLALRKSIA